VVFQGIGGPFVPTCIASGVGWAGILLGVARGDRVPAQVFGGASGLERLKAMVFVRAAIDEQIRVLEGECWAEGVLRSALADVLGISRAELYRRRSTRSGQEPPQAVTCDAGAERRRS
jgi:hypothetical protein